MPDNTIGWGQGAANNNIEWGKGASNNTIDWGAIYANSPAGDTDLGATSFDPDYQAYLDYLTANAITLPTSDQKVLQNTRVLAWKDAGIWDDADSIYHIEQNSEGAAYIDMKRLVAATPSGTPDYDSTYGWQGDGASFVTLNFTPSTDGVNCQLNNQGVLGKFYRDVTAVGTVDTVMGGASGNYPNLSPYFSVAGRMMYRLQNNVNFTVNAAVITGSHTMAATILNDDCDGYFDANNFGSQTVVPIGLSASSTTVMKQSANLNQAGMYVGIVIQGAAFSQAQVTAFHNSVI